MYFYIAREFLPALFLSSVFSVALCLVILSGFFVWYGGMQVATAARLRIDHHKESHAKIIEDRRQQCLDTD
jgi:hypothetical protein